MDQKLLPFLKILMAVVAVMIFVFTIFAVGYWYGAKTQLVGGTFEEGWQAANEKLKQSDLLPPEEEIFTLSGKITEILENRIYFQAGQVVTNPLEAPAPEDRAARITPQTKIVKLTEKYPEELEKEEEAFERALEILEPGAPEPEPPSPYHEEEIGLTALTLGDRIIVTADQNIKFATEFEAKEIRIIKEAAELVD